MAVRLAGRDGGGAGKSRTIFDDHLLLPHSGKLVGQDPRQPVGDAAGRERDHDPDRLAWIALRERAAAGGHQRRNAECDCTGSHSRFPPVNLCRLKFVPD